MIRYSSRSSRAHNAQLTHPSAGAREGWHTTDEWRCRQWRSKRSRCHRTRRPTCKAHRLQVFLDDGSQTGSVLYVHWLHLSIGRLAVAGHHCLTPTCALSRVVAHHRSATATALSCCLCCWVNPFLTAAVVLEKDVYDLSKILNSRTSTALKREKREKREEEREQRQGQRETQRQRDSKME